MIAKHRGARRQKGDYFGPFANGRAVNRALSQLQKAFLLRNCTDSVFESRTRPCLQYQIRRCSGPCAGLVSKEAYAASVEEAKRYLSGKSADMQEELAVQMREASAAMEFERAAALRDRIKALTRIQTAHGLNPRKLEEADLIALHMQGGHACVQVFFIRATQNWGNSDFYPRIADGMEEAEVLEAFIGQFYSKREAPRQLVLSHPISDPRVMSEALGGKAGRKVEIVVPRRGEKAELIDGALRNARESLARRMADTATQAKLLEGLAKALGLDGPPARIEVYDNSHIQGANPVGAMIRRRSGGLRAGAVPQVQHPQRRHRPRRRLRDDARSSLAPLPAADRNRRGQAGRPVARPRADRRRRGPGRRRHGGDGGDRRRRHCRGGRLQGT